MTVLGVTTFGGDGGKSGISRYIISMLREMVHDDHGWDIELFTLESEKDIFIELDWPVTVHGLEQKYKSPVKNILWHQTQLNGWIRKRNIDIMFLPAGNRRLPWRCSCPSVGTVHDLAGVHVDGKYDPARQFYIRQVLPWLIRKLTRVVTISTCSSDDIVQYAGVPEDRVHVIPLAADPDTYFPDNHENARNKVQSTWNFSAPYLLYISRIEHPGKNHVRLIKAFDQWKSKTDSPHCLVIAGSDWDRADEVHRAARESQHHNAIIFTGFVPSEMIPDLYRGCELFVFPSLFEGFGLPVLEAMQCGVPVICSDIASLPEVAGDAALLFDPFSIDSIADSIQKIMESDEIRKKFIVKGTNHSRHFTWKRTWEQTLEVLKMALKESKA